MKSLLTIAAVAFAMSGPAFAQTAKPSAAPSTTPSTSAASPASSQTDCQANWKSADKNSDGSLNKAEIDAGKSMMPASLPANATVVTQSEFMTACASSAAKK